MNILVLGAGVVGTASAWYLHQAGHEVTVVDRQPVAGNETSFANGGQISVSHAEPWANPHVFGKLLAWLGREDAPLLWRWRADPAQWAWGLRFLRECTPGRTRQNIGDIVSLALYSRQCLQALRRELALDYDVQTRGILHLYTDPAEWRKAEAAAAVMRDFGLDRQTVERDACLAIEPALADARDLICGGDYTPSDESGDAHRFTTGLAAHAAAAGVTFRFGTTIEGLVLDGRRLAGVRVRDHDGVPHTLKADAVVLCLGSYSPLLARQAGVRLAIVPAKGYSVTLPLAPDSVAPTVSLTDDERKLVFSRLGDRLRVAGTAEFSGYNLDPNPVRSAAILARARQWFPRLQLAGEPAFWCGLRPATPSNRPYIGRAPGVDNLWLNTGHGTLGWTLSCGSGAALAALLAGRRPPPAFPFLG